MKKEENLEKEKYIFGSLFLLANKLQVIMDRELANHDLTAKQWFLSAIIEEFFEGPPTISEVAKVMGSTHQNIKQIALKLEKNGFMDIVKDPKDRRVNRLKFTPKSIDFWQERQGESVNFLKELFKDLSSEEIEKMFVGMNKLHGKTLRIEEDQR